MCIDVSSSDSFLVINSSHVRPVTRGVRKTLFWVAFHLYVTMPDLEPPSEKSGYGPACGNSSVVLSVQFHSKYTYVSLIYLVHARFSA